MAKITPYKGQNVIHRGSPDPKTQDSRWWLLKQDSEIASSIFGVVSKIKDTQGWRVNQADLYCRLYGNLSLWNFYGVKAPKMGTQVQLPDDRPKMNVVQSCIDALISRLTQSKPKPMFLTSGGDYKKRKLAKDLNKFIDGEFYQCEAYQLFEQALRDSTILGDGLLKIVETDDHRVGLERVLCTEVLVDEMDGMYGNPQQQYQVKLMDRDVLAELFPKNKGAIMTASASYFDSSEEAADSITSQVMVVEGWHLKSGIEAKDGMHAIAINNAVLHKEAYEEADFPFTKFPYAPRTLGYWAQGLAEQLMGVQNEINRLLYTIQHSLYLCGIPKWLVEDGSKVVTSHINNQIGGIIKYQGTPPALQTFQVLPVELYQQLERLVQYAYQQSGISQMAAASQKPAGLNSGIALREYDDLQSDRFAYLSQRYENRVLDVAYKMFRKAQMIAQRDGKYQTIYPGNKAVLKIDFPKVNLKEEDFIIQAYPTSAFSKHPAQRKQEIIDLMQAGLIDPQEGRRLLDYPDIEQQQDLVNAAEERILKVLDDIVEDGKYTPPDPYMDLQKAKQLVVQYYNKYEQEGLEEAKADKLRTFSKQLDLLMMAAMPPPMAPMGGMAPQAVAAPPPVSPLLPNAP